MFSSSGFQPAVNTGLSNKSGTSARPTTANEAWSSQTAQNAWTQHVRSGEQQRDAHLMAAIQHQQETPTMQPSFNPIEWVKTEIDKWFNPEPPAEPPSELLTAWSGGESQTQETVWNLAYRNTDAKEQLQNKVV